ncbi:uncharacterized protein TNCV_2305101 [Trichonephila clavipes]|nr:uncharacterized protein TNCV_2305101 [Trichonephila clavipes]
MPNYLVHEERASLGWIDGLEKDLLVLRTKNWRTIEGRWLAWKRLLEKAKPLPPWAVKPLRKVTSHSSPFTTLPLRHEGTLNNRRAKTLLVRLVEREVRWEAPDDPQGVLPPKWGGTEPNGTVTCLVLKAKAYDRCKKI